MARNADASATAFALTFGCRAASWPDQFFVASIPWASANGFAATRMTVS